MRARARHVLVLAFVLLCCGATVHAQEQVGSVVTIEGRAEVRHRGGTMWETLAGGAPVLLGDQVRTLADGKLKIVLREDSVMTLASNSELEITEQIVAPVPVSRFRILYGTLKAIVTERYGEPRARFEVETPPAIAGVHGTAFIVQYDATTDATMVVGVSNRTWVRAADDARGAHVVEVGPGMMTTVRRGAFPSPPNPVPPGEMRRFNVQTNLKVAGTTPPREFGKGRGGAANAGDARRPLRPGERAVPPQNTVVNQPTLQGTGRPKPPPPPPPVGGR
jgi:hypothetical protein